MPKSPAQAFLLGIISGALLATLIVLHVMTNKVEAQQQSTYASMDSAEKRNTGTQEMALRVIAAWQSRAQACEAKFTVGTIVYQRQPLASFSIVHGLAAFDVNDPGSPKPSLYIPAQVDIYTNREDVRYAWIDGRTGAAKDGVHVALPPSEVK